MNALHSILGGITVSHVCFSGFEAIVPRIFPKLKSVASLNSGTSMSLYHEKCLPYLGSLKTLACKYTGYYWVGNSRGLIAETLDKSGKWRL